MPPRPGEIYYLNSIATKAKDRLGWEARTDLSAGLDKTIAMWKAARGRPYGAGSRYPKRRSQPHLPENPV